MKKLLCATLFLAGAGLTAQVDLVSNLKVCMPFTGNATDLSGNNNNGTVSSATLTSDRFGNPNCAYQFDRNTNSFISISSFLALAPTNELTIAMWAKADVTTSSCLFILNPDNQNDRCVGCAQYSNGGSTMMIWDYGDILTGGRVTVQGITIDNTAWHHYVFVTSQSGNIKQMFLDGTMNSNTTYGLSCSNKSLPFYIGGGFSNGTQSKIMWTGKIDDVMIYNRALTGADVSALYATTSICSTATGLDALTAADALAIYPTVSATGLYTISSSKVDEKSSLEIYTIDGRLISCRRGATCTATPIDLSETAPGVYLVKLITLQGEYTRKIVRQ